MKEPLSNGDAKKIVRGILAGGTVAYSHHAEIEMRADGLDRIDCVNVLRGGRVECSELVGGTWRYRVCTAKIYVVVAFRSETHMVIVTAWRKKK